MSKQNDGKVHITDAPGGKIDVEFRDGTSLKKQREFIEDVVRKTARKEPGATDESVEAAIEKFRRENKEMIEQENAEEMIFDWFGKN